MNGFQAYKYYMAVKLHFTNSRFNVFKNRGHVKGTYDAFVSRNDRTIFERMAREYNDREFIQYVASNFMYNNPNVIYDHEAAIDNYRQFIKRRQMMTRVFADDLDRIIQAGGLPMNFSGSEIPKMLQLFMADKVTVETMSILNDLIELVPKIRSNSHVELLLGNELMRIEKSKGFVKYDSDKVRKQFDLLTSN